MERYGKVLTGMKRDGKTKRYGEGLGGVEWDGEVWKEWRGIEMDEDGWRWMEMN